MKPGGVAGGTIAYVRRRSGIAWCPARPSGHGSGGHRAERAKVLAAVIPERIEPQSAADYLAVMSRAIFQAGLSWKLIASKWDDYLRLFEGFDPVLVAAFDDTDVARIMEDGGVVRTRKKIVATIENARTLLALERERGSFRSVSCGRSTVIPRSPPICANASPFSAN